MPVTSNNTYVIDDVSMEGQLSYFLTLSMYAGVVLAFRQKWHSNHRLVLHLLFSTSKFKRHTVGLYLGAPHGPRERILMHTPV
eukprot:scaffold216_cov340-Prasinococcus_capsulatus_cf.AAC.5